VESRKSEDNPFRDYYIWRKPTYDSERKRKEPNNWQSVFSGPAWEYDERTGEYFLHLFTKRQPDLNWENDKVRNEIYDMMNWWFDKGIDGFRMDVINLISKYPGLPEFDYTIPMLENKTFFNGPRLHEFIQEMNRNCMQKHDVMTVGECGWMTVEEGKKLIGKERNELDMIFQMDHVMLGEGKEKWDYVPWKLTDLKKIIKKWDDAIKECDGWGSNFLMNHDQPRSVSKFGNDREYRVESAKMLAVFTMSLKGTPYIYQGDEIGMTNIKIDDINDYRDVEIFNHYKIAIANGKSHEKLMEGYNRKGRDNSRTPMQWDDSQNAGFTKGKPWIKVNPNYVDINVEKERKDNKSIFNFYKKMIECRLRNYVLAYGDYIPVMEDDESIFAFYRKTEEEKVFVILNFSDKQAAGIDEKVEEMELIISNYDDAGEADTLRPYEARIYKA
jgi:oligo-1,6-glucosidase